MSQPNTAPFTPVKPDVQIPAQEEALLGRWDELKVFARSMDPAKPTYSFYDGPPFATGLPHYGHLLQGIIKDVVPRYWTMRGFNVPRRFGWDCHGLPVEHEINKQHGIQSRKDVLRMGVAEYNAACRGIVKRYSEEWKAAVRRMGRWVDMDRPYFTMDVAFMESVWWVFKELYQKGLIYDGYKVVPYSTGISTSLSNFEANLNYKMVQDPAVTVLFPVQNEPGTSFLAWTTTPWTLPSNLALAVGADLDYVKVKEISTGRALILAEARLAATFKNPAKDVEILERRKGSQLVDLSYEPLFSYFAEHANQGAFRVVIADHVTTESGTGIVHMAPAYGEEDYQACARAGIELVNPVDDDGVFTDEVPDFAGVRVKDADKGLIAEIKKKNRLFKHDVIEHSYPYCYRSDTPLIYRAVSSWFVAVEKIKDQLVKNNQATRWVPEHLRDGRFGNWLENARDWAISRNRFWGTPLPLWRNREGETLCVGSKAELEKLSGRKIDDLHIEFVDDIEIPSPTGQSPLRRVGGVLDCWFESGSMPYAQWGYPKTNAAEFKKAFPADFIAEAVDQTRGWFYTLSVIGTALFDQAPFRNVITSGLVLAEDGRKMSKSLRNYPDPIHVLNEHGADALRLYLINSPVVKGQELKFSERAVYDVVRKILLRWWNSYSFFVNYANIDQFRPRGDAASSTNILDQWVLSRLSGLVENTRAEMEAYRLYNVVPHLLRFIEELTNTYIRFNRGHFWESGSLNENEAKRFAYETLHEVLLTLAKLMAPFAPFMAEATYLNLARVLSEKCDSVHLESFPEADPKRRRPDLEEAVAAMDALVNLGRNHREKIGIKAKVPLRTIRIIHRDAKVLETLRRFEPYFMDELNFRAVHYDANEDQFVQVTAKANFPVLGKRLGPKMKVVGGAIQKLALGDILRLEKGESVTVAGEAITLADVEIRRGPRPEHPNVSVDQIVSIEVDPTVDAEQEREGLAREVMRKIQQARKNADLRMDDRIQLEISGPDSVRAAIEAHRDQLVKETLAASFEHKSQSEAPRGAHVEKVDLDGLEISIGVTAIDRA